MSNQSVDGFQGSQPFISDKEYKSLSLDQLKYILNQKKQGLKDNYKELSEKEKIIRDIRKVDKLSEKVKQGIDIKKERKKKLKTKKIKKGNEIKKIKTFDEYFKECIENKEIPSDTPSYLREALERAILEYDQGIVKEKSAFENFANKYIIEGEPGLTPVEFLNRIYDKLKGFFIYHRNIKFNMILVCLMEHQKIDKNRGVVGLEEFKAYFTSGIHINLESTNVEKLINKCVKRIIEDLEAFQQNGSGWYFKEVVQLEIHTVENGAMKGSSYIPLPDWISNKKAIVNIENKDEKCFLWCILRYLYPREDNGNRLTDLKKYENSLNTKGISFPMKLKHISKLEKLNPSLPGINVFSVNENKKFYPLKMAEKDCLNTIDLFFFEQDGVSHYSLIKNFTRLVKSQLTSSKNGTVFICKKCFSHFTKNELLQNHITYCSNNETVVVKMPPQNTMLGFKNYHKQLPIPFVVYADFECFTKPMNTCSPNPEYSYTYNYQKHEPSGFCFYIKGINPNITFKPIIYTKTNSDDNVAAIFVSKLAKVTNRIYNDFYNRPIPLRLTRQKQISFDKSETCHICKKELLSDKVRDHCHFTGQYRGAAHNSCNLQCRKPMILPVIFHNLQGYDAHLFVKQLACLPGELNCIPSTEEKYISFSKKIKVDEYKSRRTGETISLYFEIRFEFLQTSLANLVGNLQPDDFYNRKEVFKENINLLTRKGVYPYDYVSSNEKLSETQLPPKEEFYSKLNDEDITDDDYQHAINVWNTFKCKTIRDYHDLYLKSHVLLLSDVFENFRKTCLKHYNLDPAHYYTSPGLAWDACLKETGQELQLRHDYDMLMMFEKGIRGRISHISKRYAETNNKYMDNYDFSKPTTYIQYLDANNLYGWAMSQSLPTHGFKWMKDLTIDSVIDLLDKKRNPEVKKGYIFEVDLEYPTELWKSHNDYPLAPEKMIVNGVEKLICHFKPRKNYVVHYQNLRQYLEMGIRLTAVHRGISFYQSSWMEPYIRKNTELRKTAANSFEKDFFKLMNNSVFGKTIENIRKRQNIFLVDDRKKAVKLTSRPNFERATIRDRNLIAVHMKFILTNQYMLGKQF